MNIYQTNILDKYENPKHRGKPENYTHSHLMQNLACGDEVIMYLTVANDYIKDIHFVGEGCVISLAAAEVLAEELVGKTVAEVTKLSWENVVEMLGIELSLNRIKCAHLPLEAIQKACPA